MIPTRRTAWPLTAMSVYFFGGDDASRSIQNPKFHLSRRPDALPCDVAGGEPCLRAGGSAARLHRRCFPALLIGNPERGADHRLHDEAPCQPERGVPQGFRPADRPGRLAEVMLRPLRCGGSGFGFKCQTACIPSTAAWFETARNASSP